MGLVSTIKWSAYISTLVVFVGGFLLFYYQTDELIGSFFAALCSALLILGTFVVFAWIAESTRKS